MRAPPVRFGRRRGRLIRQVMASDLVLFLVGLVMVYLAAHWLVRGSSSLATTLGLAPIVVGLTVVAFGTSAPELVISVVSSLKGKSMIAVGNVVGSNICNISLVLGLAALVRPLTGNRSLLKRDLPIMLGVTLYLFLVSLDSRLGSFEGATLFGGAILYTFFNYRFALRESVVRPVGIPMEKRGSGLSLPKQVLLIVVGIAGVVGGAEILIDSAVKLMRVFGVSEKFIGLTLVALGTSLPELATSVVAAMKNEMDISVGNLVGSNVFNILSVLGAASLVRPITLSGGFVESGLLVDYLVMAATSFLPFLMMRKTLVLNRKDGFMLLLCYAGYIVYLGWTQA